MSASRVLAAKSRSDRRISLALRSSLISTVSKPAFLNMPPTSPASFTGFASRGAFL
jgi:hypothetical protein